jgi:hypothetical protein
MMTTTQYLIDKKTRHPQPDFKGLPKRVQSFQDKVTTNYFQQLHIYQNL